MKVTWVMGLPRWELSSEEETARESLMGGSRDCFDLVVEAFLRLEDYAPGFFRFVAMKSEYSARARIETNDSNVYLVASDTTVLSLVRPREQGRSRKFTVRPSNDSNDSFFGVPAIVDAAKKAVEANAVKRAAKQRDAEEKRKKDAIQNARIAVIGRRLSKALGPTFKIEGTPGASYSYACDSWKISHGENVIATLVSTSTADRFRAHTGNSTSSYSGVHLSFDDAVALAKFLSTLPSLKEED